MEEMALFGSTFGLAGFLFAVFTWKRVSKLEKALKDTGVLDKQYKSGILE